MNSYATTDQLTAWLADLGVDPPADAAGLLRSASLLVAAAANRDIYTDVPDATAAQVLADATCAQVAAWVTLGVTPAAAGIDTAPVKGKKLGSADLSYDTTGQSEARIAAATALAPEAQKILYTAGLLALELPVWTDPDSDPLADYGLDRTRIGLRPPWWSTDLARDWP